MSKTAVDTIVAKIKRRADYNVTGDTDLDALILDAMNDGLKMIKQSLYDYGLYEDISQQATFKTDALQAFTDIQQAKIVGNIATFTAVAADAITVAIDGGAAVPVVLTGLLSVAGVVATINGTAGLTGVASTIYKAGSGTVTIAGATNVTGTDTQFTTDFVVGEYIRIDSTGEERAITAITSDTIMTIAAATNVTGSTYKYSGLYPLVITSPTSGATSSVTVAQTTGSPLARLFASSTDWTQSAISDLDEILMMSERTYKFALLGMAYQDFIAMYPDPASITAVVPDIYCRWDNRIYFGPTPNAYSLLYLDYIFEITEVVAGGTLPFQDRYDPLLIAFCKAELMEWLDSQNATGITAAKLKVKELKNDLIILASRNVKLNRQTASRRNMIPYFSPRKKIVA
jgi:hypothetical protein